MSAVLPPQERLGLSRAGLRELLVSERDEDASDTFPRSATMRLLLGRGRSRFAGAAAGAALFWLVPSARKLLKFIPLSTLVRMLLQYRR